MLVGVAATIGVIAALLLAAPAKLFFSSMSAPVCPTPCTETVRLGPGTYVVFERVGRSIGGGGFSYTQVGPTTIGPSDVHVTSSAGESIQVVGMPGDSSQTLDRGGAVYNGVARLRVPRAADYRVEVSAPSPTSVVVAPDVGRMFLRALPGLGVGALAALVGGTGLILLLVAWSRRRAVRT